MRDYGVVSSTFWTSEDISKFSDQGKLLALYLLTGPHSNIIGCYRLPFGYVQDDLNWNNGTVSKGFSELSRNGFATHDSGSNWVLVHKYLKWNPIENPNQGKFAEKIIRQIPSNFSIYNELVMAIEQYGRHISEGLLNSLRTLSKGLHKPFRNQEQEPKPKPKQDQHQDQEQDFLPQKDAAGDFDDFDNPKPENSHNESKTTKPKQKREYSEGFLRFWESYPKKEDKPDAFRAFNNALGRTGLDVEELIARIKHALIWQKASDKWNESDGKFIPQPATYLNGDRWEDQSTEEAIKVERKARLEQLMKERGGKL
jgi:hypothetical protein